MDPPSAFRPWTEIEGCRVRGRNLLVGAQGRRAMLWQATNSYITRQKYARLRINPLFKHYQNRVNPRIPPTTIFHPKAMGTIAFYTAPFGIDALARLREDGLIVPYRTGVLCLGDDWPVHLERLRGKGVSD